jgi:hypothetical protein
MKFEDELQEWLGQVNAQDPPDYDAPSLLGIYRHPCERARHPFASTAISLKERYVTPAEAQIADDTSVALVFREGVCKRCGKKARSSRGRMVDTATRPPITGRVAR